MRFLVHISTPWTFMLVESTQLQMWNFRIFESRIEATRAPCSVQETSCCMNPGRCLVEPPVRRWNNSGSMVDGWHFTTIFSWYLGIIRRCLLWKKFPRWCLAAVSGGLALLLLLISCSLAMASHSKLQPVAGFMRSGWQSRNVLARLVDYQRWHSHQPTQQQYAQVANLLPS